MEKEQGGPAAPHVFWPRGAAHPPAAPHRLVSGSGDIKLTKDGNVLLQEMVSWGCSSQGGSGRDERPWVRGDRVPHGPTLPYPLKAKCPMGGG